MWKQADVRQGIPSTSPKQKYLDKKVSVLALSRPDSLLSGPLYANTTSSSID